MTDDQIKEFIEYWGDRLPNPEHYPRQFQYCVLVYKHVRGIK